MEALYRYPKHKRRLIAQTWARRSNKVQAEARLEREPDFETIRFRALDDARGEVIRRGVTYKGNGDVVQWEVRRSLRGRTDQLDVIAAGRLLFMGGPRRVRSNYGIKS